MTTLRTRKGSTPAQQAHPKALDQDGNNALAHASCAQIQFRVENNAAVGSMNTTFALKQFGLEADNLFFL